MDKLAAGLRRWPTLGLVEVITIKAGQIVRIYP
jgi:hypothetical protein